MPRSAALLGGSSSFARNQSLIYFHGLRANSLTEVAACPQTEDLFLEEKLGKAFVHGYSEADKAPHVILSLVEPFDEVLFAARSLLTLLTAVPDPEMFTTMASYFDVKASFQQDAPPCCSLG